jgi:hypothetical protein
MLRFMGDNGKPNDNMLMHILSPYAKHPKRADDCQKLTGSGFELPYALLIYGYDHDDWPMEPAVEAFEQLARYRVQLGPRQLASFDGLIHPVHQWVESSFGRFRLSTGYRSCPLLWRARGTAGQNDDAPTWRRRLPARPPGEACPR